VKVNITLIGHLIEQHFIEIVQIRKQFQLENCSTKIQEHLNKILSFNKGKIVFLNYLEKFGWFLSEAKHIKKRSFYDYFF
jgi:hypothetical protein